MTQQQAAFVQHLDGSATLHLAIVLPLRDEAGLQGFLDNLQTPGSPNYRQYLSVEKFTEMFGPSQKDYDAVVRWARENGLVVTETAPNRLVVQVNGRVSDVERALHVTMNVYQHPTENRTFFAPDREPTTDLSVQLWHVSGLDDFVIPRPANLARNENAAPNATGSGPGGEFLGTDMRKAYYGTGSLNGSGQSVGLLEYVGYNPADVTRYFTNYGPANSVTITPISTDGTPATCTTCDDTEQALDIEQAVSMAPSMISVVVYVGSTDTAMLNRMVSDNSCKSISCSWAWRPADSKTDDPIFAEMAGQGQTFLAASGDSGSYTSGGYYFPGEDGNVIAVGGTDLVTNGAGGTWKSETAWSDSTGGISPDHLPIPSYQKNKKFAKVVGISKTYRNVPDIAAEGNFDNEVCYDGSCGGGWGGTSFAAPRWAGYLALANQQAVAGGGSTLGFLNPTFYKIGLGKAKKYNANFHDILSGSNGAYSAVKGYDLVTGFGSPNGPTLINTLTQ
ncbi:MAG TPA: S53 family peptidase [Chthoniobacterales bacterium]